MKKRNNKKLFVAIGVTMVAVGTYAILSCVTGGRISAENALPMPFGFTTAVVGALLLTRSAISVFFLMLYAVTILILGIIHNGVLSPLNLVWLAVLGLGVVLAGSLRPKRR